MRANLVIAVLALVIGGGLVAAGLLAFDAGLLNARPTDGDATNDSRQKRGALQREKDANNNNNATTNNALQAIAPFIPADERRSWQPKELVGILGTGRGRHWGEIYKAARSHDGRWIASVGEDRVIRVWNARLQEQAVLPFWCFSVAFSPDSKTLAASTGYEILLWDMTGEEPRPRAQFRTNGSDVKSLAFSPDSTLLASGDRRGMVRLWNCQDVTPSEVTVVDGEVELIHSVVFSPAGDGLAASGLRGIHLWSLKGEQLKTGAVLKDHQKPVWSVSFTADGKRLASASYDGTVKLWDLTKSTPTVQTTLPTENGQAFSVAFGPHAKTLAVGCGQAGMIQVWNVETDTPKKKLEFRRHKGHVWSLIFSQDGKTLTSASRDGSIRLWDVTGTRPKELVEAGQPAFVYSIAFSPDGRKLASGHIGAIRVWNLRGQRPEQERLLEGGINPVMSLSFSPRNQWLAAAYNHKRVELWNLSLEMPRPVTVSTSYAGSANPVAFSPDGQTLACVMVGSKPVSRDSDGREDDTPAPSDHIVQLMDVDGMESTVRASLKGHDHDIKSLAFSPSGETIAVSSGPVVKLWDLSGKQPVELATLKGHDRNVMSVAFTPDGKTLVSAGMDTIVVVWDISGKRPTKKASLDIHTGYGTSVAIAPDGKLFASAGADGRVVVCSAADSRKRHEWQLPGLVYQVAFTPDGRHLATANRNGTVYIFRVPR